MVSFGSQSSHLTNTSHVADLLMKLETVHPECFLQIVFRETFIAIHFIF